jgi:hypothetical protein
MMQVVPQWRVSVWSAEGETQTVELSIADNHLSNVLRKLADITFKPPAVKMRIEREGHE